MIESRLDNSGSRSCAIRAAATLIAIALAAAPPVARAQAVPPSTTNSSGVAPARSTDEDGARRRADGFQQAGLALTIFGAVGMGVATAGVIMAADVCQDAPGAFFGPCTGRKFTGIVMASAAGSIGAAMLAIGVPLLVVGTRRLKLLGPGSAVTILPDISNNKLTGVALGYSVVF